MARPGLNGSVVVSAPCEHFEAVADRIVEHDQVLDLALLGERARAARERTPCAARGAPRRRRARRRRRPPSRRSRARRRCPRAPRDAACGRPCGTSRCRGSCRPAACRGTGWRRPSSPRGSWCEGRCSPASASSSQVSCGNNARFAPIVPRQGGATERFDMPCIHRPQTPNFHGCSSARPGLTDRPTVRRRRRRRAARVGFRPIWPDVSVAISRRSQRGVQKHPREEAMTTQLARIGIALLASAAMVSAAARGRAGAGKRTAHRLHRADDRARSRRSAGTCSTASTCTLRRTRASSPERR